MTTSVSKVFDLGVGGAGCSDIRISTIGVSLLAEVQYLVAGRTATETVVYSDVIAFRFRDEMHSQGFYEQAYDTVIEVFDSQWLHELAAIEPTGLLSGVAGKRHFATLFSNFGYLEVLAENAHVTTDAVSGEFGHDD